MTHGRLSPSRRRVIMAMAGATATSSAKAQVPPIISDARGFVAIGDWGRGGDRDQIAIAQAMAQAATELHSRFVISVGDNFYPAGVQSADDPQWRTSFENVYTHPALQTPWYAALGNHDYRGHAPAQVAYAKRGGRWRMPAASYVVGSADLGIPDLNLFVLDTTPLVGDHDEAAMRLLHGRIGLPAPDAQMTWFREALKASRANWKIVVGHHPIYSGGHHGSSSLLASRLEPLFKAHGVNAYLCGHDHVLQHIQRDGVAHICTGAGASAGTAKDIPGTLFRNSETGFAMFRLEASALQLEFRNAEGRSLYQAYIPQNPA